jgi:hypothetical protein
LSKIVWKTTHSPLPSGFTHWKCVGVCPKTYSSPDNFSRMLSSTKSQTCGKLVFTSPVSFHLNATSLRVISME